MRARGRWGERDRAPGRERRQWGDGPACRPRQAGHEDRDRRAGQESRGGNGEAAVRTAQNQEMRIGILTISDLGAVGQRADTSGDAILAWASECGYEVVVRSVVSDETDRIAGKLVRWADSGEVDVVLTTGGTGLTERDVTPQATAAILERDAEGS